MHRRLGAAPVPASEAVHTQTVLDTIVGYVRQFQRVVVTDVRSVPIPRVHGGVTAVEQQVYFGFG